jgi:hypothetical protein
MGKNPGFSQEIPPKTPLFLPYFVNVFTPQRLIFSKVLLYRMHFTYKAKKSSP